MTKTERDRLATGLHSLSVFRGILQTEPMKNLSALLDEGEGVRARMEDYARLVYSLGEYGCSLSEFLRRAAFEDENAYIIAAAEGKSISKALDENAKSDLRLMSTLTHLSGEELFGDRDGYDGELPRLENEPLDLIAEYGERAANIGKYGYGVFAGARMFRLEGERIVPVGAADEADVGGFVGYEKERSRVFENTRALISGGHAANILLFGDAGTGKSSTVKACANYFADAGVRLIELRRDQILLLSSVMAKIAKNPLKFIIFIDDLSFGKNDDSFSMLKAALEGSASARAKNAVIYATSNRRHIVRESFSDRDGDDVHHGDTMQELMSLSDRFGLVVYFGRPDKRLYLDIVRALAERSGVGDTPELDAKAEAFALAKGSRSPRAAGQFVESLLQKNGVEKENFT